MEINMNEDFVPTVKKGEKITAKLRSDFSKDETEKVVKKFRALNILFCGLDSNESNSVSACDRTKEVLDILETTHEGISEVRESKISLYIY